MIRRPGTTYLRPEQRERHMTPLVELLHVSVDAVDADGSTHALVNDVSMSIARGEYIAVTGPGGAGKSTLVHVIGLVESASRGRVVLDGIDIAAIDSRARNALRTRSTGIVRSWHYLLTDLDVIENVVLPMRLIGTSARIARDRAMHLLDAVGVSGHSGDRTGALSRDVLQRVATARALANEPLVLLADEPTASLSAEDSDRYFDLLQTLNVGGQTVIVSTQDPRLAYCAPRRVHLHEGHLVNDEEDAGQ